MDNLFSFDGNELLDAMFFAACKDEKDRVFFMSLKAIFAKYNITFTNGMALLLEVSTLLQNREKKDDTVQ